MNPSGRTISGTFDRLGDARRFFAGLADGLVCGRFVDPGQAASARRLASGLVGDDERLQPKTEPGSRSGHHRSASGTFGPSPRSRRLISLKDRAYRRRVPMVSWDDFVESSVDEARDFGTYSTESSGGC